MMGETKRAEWARAWPLPLIGMLGITGPAAFAYSSGVFMEAMTGEFGWSRAEFTSAMMIMMLVGLVSGPAAGHILDRVGARRMLLWGIPPAALALAVLGLASGTIGQWWLLAVLFAPLSMGVMTGVWIAGTMTRFDVSRGLAISVVLAGMGVATAGWPLIAAALVEAIGWRLAFPAMALGWLLLVYPLTWAFFRPAPIVRAGPVSAEPAALWPVLRSRTFLFLLLAASLFSSVQLALIVHFVPIVRGFGLDLSGAAQFATLIGIFSIFGRIGTGYLLDRLPTPPLALVAFSLPLAVMAALASSDGSILSLGLAAVLLGIAAGSEMDIVTYLATRKFDPRIFGTAYSILQAAIAISASIGPLLAGRLFDLSGSYANYYMVAAPIIVAATLFIMLVPMKPDPAAAA